jgi:uncharacterized protein (TIGR03084 family)
VSPRPTLADVTSDLAAEHGELEGILPTSDTAWDVATPAAGWTVRDTVSHLAFFDEQATLAMQAPQDFRDGLARVFAEPESFMNAAAERGRVLEIPEVRRWWQRARAELLAAFDTLDPAARLPWYGPDMSAVSFATARLMETWAHGQDIADALGVRRTPTARLRHVAHLGVQTFTFSFVARGREAPTVPIRVDLVAPDGSAWVWGPEDAADRVTGSALGFCLLVTQRRHRDDTDVTASGSVATEWLSLAQAFAGPAGAGRAPGLPAYA